VIAVTCACGTQVSEPARDLHVRSQFQQENPMKSHTSFLRRKRVFLYSSLLLMTLVASSWAPPNLFAGDETWLPINPADLALKAPIVEPDADAEAIFWDIRIDDAGENDLVLSHYVRIKIFTELGRQKQSKIDIPFLSGTKIKDVAARTIKSDGSIIELTKQDIIEKTVVKANGVKLRTKTFAFPGIEPGAIIEYKWKEVISNASANYLRLQFQRDIPVQAVTYHVKPSSESGTFNVRAFNMETPTFQKEKNGFVFATVLKVPAFHEEPLMPPEDNVRSWAMIRYNNLFSLLSSYTIQASRMNVALLPYLKVDADIKRKADEITAGTKTAEEKLERIFTFVRTNIKNTDRKDSGFTDEQLEKMKENKKSADTLKRGVGPGIDVNLLFGALANASGIDAHIALLPDRSMRIFDRNVVIPGAFRRIVIAVKVGGGWKFLDPGLLYSTPDMSRWQYEGVDALIADDRPEWVRTPFSAAEKSKEKRTAKLSLAENGTLEGDVTIEYTGHLGTDRKLQNDDDSPVQRDEDLKEAVKSRLSSAEVSNIVIENVTDPDKPFIYKYHVRVPDYAQRTGKRLFFQPGFFHKGIGAVFTTSSRRYAIYFRFPWSEEDHITIDLPKGFDLDNADRPNAISAGTISQHAIKMGITDDHRTFVYNRTFFFGGGNAIYFPVESYEQLKRLFDHVDKADNHIITLKQMTATN